MTLEFDSTRATQLPYLCPLCWNSQAGPYISPERQHPRSCVTLARGVGGHGEHLNVTASTAAIRTIFVTATITTATTLKTRLHLQHHLCHYLVTLRKSASVAPTAHRVRSCFLPGYKRALVQLVNQELPLPVNRVASERELEYTYHEKWRAVTVWKNVTMSGSGLVQSGCTTLTRRSDSGGDAYSSASQRCQQTLGRQ